MYAYVDETGNTGANIFDKVQPDFFLAALICRNDFDRCEAAKIRQIARRIGKIDLHAKIIGADNLELIAADLLKTFRQAGCHFFVSRVEKRYLLAAKMFDYLFDSGENAAVAWHNYNIRPLKLMLMFKLSHLIDEEIGRSFWSCLMEKKKAKATSMVPAICEALIQNVDMLPDARSREIITQGLTWAKENPKAIHIHADAKIARQGHLPNLVAFSNLMRGIDDYSKQANQRLTRITHDRQTEFDATLKHWHELFSNASPEPVGWAGETYVLQALSRSSFEVRASSDSPGIQAVDVVLWLYARLRKGGYIPPACGRLLHYVLKKGWENDFSFSGVQRMCLEKWGDVMRTPLSEETEQTAREMLARMENNRVASVQQYAEDGIVPFARTSTQRKTIEP